MQHQGVHGASTCSGARQWARSPPRRAAAAGTPRARGRSGTATSSPAQAARGGSVTAAVTEPTARWGSSHTKHEHAPTARQGMREHLRCHGQRGRGTAAGSCTHLGTSPYPPPAASPPATAPTNIVATMARLRTESRTQQGVTRTNLAIDQGVAPAGSNKPSLKLDQATAQTHTHAHTHGQTHLRWLCSLTALIQRAWGGARTSGREWHMLNECEHAAPEAWRAHGERQLLQTPSQTCPANR